MIFKRLREDIDSVMERDPAARSRIDVVFLYPGFHAILIYRMSSSLWRNGFRFLGLWLSQFGRFLTGIEIHPGAIIGRRFFIDHGQGVVVGETAEIGDDVTLYQAVTLGGIAPSVDSHLQKGTKRHPTLENGVIVGSGAQVLGPVTVAEDARIGANAVVTKDVPSGVTAVGIPARVVMPKDKEHAKDFAPYGTSVDGEPDPMQRTLDNLRAQIENLMTHVSDLEGELASAKTKPAKSKKTKEKKVISGGKP